jgi:DNA-binding transcriptional LysR family regulator
LDRLTSMTVFAKVAATRSFSAAARELGISQATASKHVQTLEAWFGMRLLHRTTRRVGLTEAGEGFFSLCTRILEDMDAALEAGKPDARLRGTLRISAPVAFGSTCLGPLMVDFMRQSPLLCLSVSLSDRPVDVIEDGFDVALSVGLRGQESGTLAGLVVQTLAQLRFVLCASPKYLADRGTPLTPLDLADHACLTDTRHPGDVWRFHGLSSGVIDVAVCGSLKTDNGLLRRTAALAGAGVLLGPEFLVADQIAAGDLVRVLPDYTPRGATLDAASPDHRATTPKVRSLIAFLGERLQTLPKVEATEATGQTA